MKIYIDFENVHHPGFQGLEYLNHGDELYLFYSECCCKIARGILKRLFDSGCAFQAMKLVRAGRNALDFYIASHIGETVGKGYRGIIAIISNDKGFQAICDYWQERDPSVKIIRKPTIASAIMVSNEPGARHAMVCQDYEEVDLTSTCPELVKKEQIRSALGRACAQSQRIKDIENLVEDLLLKQPNREIYLRLIKDYGMRDGCAIYQVLKQIS